MQLTVESKLLSIVTQSMNDADSSARIAYRLLDEIEAAPRIYVTQWLAFAL